MTEQLFLLYGDTVPEGAVFVAEDVLVQRDAARRTTRVTGQRYMVTWKIIGAHVKTTMCPVRLVELNSGIHAYTNVGDINAAG